MYELPQIIPDVDHLLLLEPEELGSKMLFALKARRGNGANQNMFILGNLHSELGRSAQQGGNAYPTERGADVETAMSEAWAWLESQGLLVPAPGSNGSNGWRVLSRRAKQFADEGEFARFEVGRRLPRDMLNPRIRQVVWAAFMRGEFDVGVFLAMKAVEVAVREASGLSDALGVDLVRRAFRPENGPLTDMAADGGERQARSDLFAGAIGSFKNPHSHRDVDINDPEEALEIILLANHLLRIVDARAGANANA